MNAIRKAHVAKAVTGGLGRVRGHPCGQAMVEYIIVAGVLSLSVVLLALFLYAFREHAGRVLDLVAYDYP